MFKPDEREQYIPEGKKDKFDKITNISTREAVLSISNFLHDWDTKIQYMTPDQLKKYLPIYSAAKRDEYIKRYGPTAMANLTNEYFKTYSQYKPIHLVNNMTELKVYKILPAAAVTVPSITLTPEQEASRVLDEARRKASFAADRSVSDKGIVDYYNLLKDSVTTETQVSHIARERYKTEQLTKDIDADRQAYQLKILESLKKQQAIADGAPLPKDGNKGIDTSIIVDDEDEVYD